MPEDPQPTIADALALVSGAKAWLEEPDRAEAIGFDPTGSAIQLLDRAEETLMAIDAA